MIVLLGDYRRLKMQEIEAKILEVDVEKVRQKLLLLGAKIVFSSRFEYYDFDNPKLKLRKNDLRLRLRRRISEKQGELTFKGRKTRRRCHHKVREEFNAQVDFDEMLELLLKLGFTICYYRQNFREEWEFKDCKIEIDTYPVIPLFIELEGSSEEKIIHLAENLGFKKRDLRNYGVAEVLRHYGLPENGSQSISYLVFESSS